MTAILRILSVSYERHRLAAWLQGNHMNSLDTGYQLDQSLIALGSGGFGGRGFGHSVQKFHFLPAPHTDFIFAIIGEEGGFVVASLVLLVYALIVARAFRVAARLPDTFGGLVAAGIGIMIGVQVLLNVAVVTGLIPTTGLPLPLLSYGGSSLIVHLAAIGVLLRLSKDAVPSLPRGLVAEPEG
jgi:cell division protein FtsW